jgi:hypothetical protein
VYRRRIKRTVGVVATFLGYANDRRNRRTWCIGARRGRTKDGPIAPEDWPNSHRGRGSVVVFPGLPCKETIKRTNSPQLWA